MPSIHRAIWNKLGVKGGDIMPLNGAPWNMTSTRGTLAQLMGEFGFKTGAEIGVETGTFSKTLCNSIPGLKLFCVDPWKAYARQSQSREDVIYEQAKVKLAGCNVEIMKMTSLEASQKIADGSLDFVYIDALHEFDPVMMDIILWSPKVRSGGIVSGHDYLHYYQYGIIQAVHAYTQAHSINPWYITTGETANSFFWVKP